eukprot:scaffold183818_cov25-Tisochrysis_lutea.AAC.5
MRCSRQNIRDAALSLLSSLGRPRSPSRSPPHPTTPFSSLPEPQSEEKSGSVERRGGVLTIHTPRNEEINSTQTKIDRSIERPRAAERRGVRVECVGQPWAGGQAHTEITSSETRAKCSL